MSRTRDTNPRAYDLVVELRRRYAGLLEQRGLTSPETVSASFNRVRIDILMGILRTTPGDYRVNDARFLLGAIHWEEGRGDEAVRWWRQLTGDPTDSHAGTYQDIASSVRAADSRGPAAATKVDAELSNEVQRILARDHARWLFFSLDRLKRFGFRFDTF